MEEITIKPYGLIVLYMFICSSILVSFGATIFSIFAYGYPLISNAVNILEFLISIIILVFVVLVVNVLALPIHFIVYFKLRKVNIVAPKKLVYENNKVIIVRFFGNEIVELVKINGINKKMQMSRGQKYYVWEINYINNKNKIIKLLINCNSYKNSDSFFINIRERLN